MILDYDAIIVKREISWRNDELLLPILIAFTSSLAQYTPLEMPDVFSPCVTARRTVVLISSPHSYVSNQNPPPHPYLIIYAIQRGLCGLPSLLMMLLTHMAVSVNTLGVNPDAPRSGRAKF
jgi:hypothetical protein